MKFNLNLDNENFNFDMSDSEIEGDIISDAASLMLK